MVVIICALLALSLAIALLAPFWLCEEGVLLPSTIAKDPAELARQKQKILEAYCNDEEALKAGTISPREWRTRKAYLINRYVDLSRRSDFLARVLLIILCLGSFAGHQNRAYAASAEVGSEIGLSPRHIVIITADLDSLWGSYFFAVNNPLSVPQRFRTQVIVPKEAMDFRPQDGFTVDEMSIDQEGKIFVEKEFRPGLSLLSLSFQSKVALFSDDVLTFTSPFFIPEFSVAVGLASNLHLVSPEFTEGLPHMLSASSYRGMMSEGIEAGKTRKMVIQGIPKTRNYLYLVALGFTFLLFTASLGFVLSQKSRSHETEGI